MILRGFVSFYILFFQLVVCLTVSNQAKAVARVAIELKLNSNHSKQDIESLVRKVSETHGLKLIGPVGTLRGIYQFETPYDPPIYNGSDYLVRFRRKRLEQDTHIRWYQEQIARKRYKRDSYVVHEYRDGFSQQRDSYDKMSFSDPYYPRQWHLHGEKSINVVPVWSSGIKGKGINVAVLDDGLFKDHIDLAPNYNPLGSYDFVRNVNDPSPQDQNDFHGTRCAGEISAVANNSVCGVGVAYESKISGIRVLSDQGISDATEAQAINFEYHVNHIYSNSWGPNDDGKTVEGPGRLFKKALIDGTNNGRDGKGSIIVFAAGNGGRYDDNCNFDGYANSVYTLTIGAIDRDDQRPSYGELCAAQLLVTYSSGQSDHIVTTDWGVWKSNAACTIQHGGTSAAAPLAAGVFALVLQVRPDLTWRDLQWLCVESGILINPEDPGWRQNDAKRFFSHKYGFGKLDATILVENAKKWELVGPQTSFRSEIKTINRPIPPRNTDGLRATIEIPDTPETRQILQIEHVTATVDVTHPYRGSLEIDLISPHGMISQLATRRKEDRGTRLNRWTFMTVANWGETPQGNWTLHVRNAIDSRAGYFYSWSIQIFGEKNETSETPEPEPEPEPLPTPTTNTSIPTEASNTTDVPTTNDPTTKPDNIPISNDSLPSIKVIDADPTLSYAKGTMENLAITIAAIGGLGVAFLTLMGIALLLIQPQIRGNQFSLSSNQAESIQESHLVANETQVSRVARDHPISFGHSEDRLTLYEGSDSETSD